MAGAGVLLTLVGLTFKIGAVPFHFWVPDTYSGAPPVVAAYLAVVSKAAGLAGLVIVVSHGFPSFAGVWGHYTAQKGLLEQGDVEEALNAAQQIGDDTLQKRMQGYVVPESFNHGTSEQRQKWFAAGLQSGKLSSCDTFNNPI